MKSFVLLLATIVSIFVCNSQTTTIPDINFEQALIDLGYDSGTPDGNVLTENIVGITNLNVNGKNINSLTGIEDFTSLTELICYNNNISYLDLTHNTALTVLRCSDNLLTSLDVTKNPLLTYLRCSSNQIENLDVSKNTALTNLNCGDNNISELDVSKNTQLKELICHFLNIDNLDLSNNFLLTDLICNNNQLTFLNLSEHSNLSVLRCDNNQLKCLNLRNGNNHNFKINNPPQMQSSYYVFFADNNPDLTCIEVDDPSWSVANWPRVDTQTSFSYNCSNDCSGKSKYFTPYPNPTHESFKVDLGMMKTEIIASLINSLGKEILLQNFNSANIISINISAPAGIYFLKIKTSEGDSEIMKIVKE